MGNGFSQNKTVQNTDSECSRGVARVVCNPAGIEGWNDFNSAYKSQACELIFHHSAARHCPICRETGTYHQCDPEYTCELCLIPHCEHHAQKCHRALCKNNPYIHS